MEPKDVVKRIIDAQSQIVGPKIAKSRAVASGAIRIVSEQTTEVDVVQEPSLALENLINSYAEIFGRSSIDVCIDVLKTFPYEQISSYIPTSIKGIIEKQKVAYKQI